MNDFIQEIDDVLNGFIHGTVKVANFQQYLALEQIAVIVNRYRPKDLTQEIDYLD